MCVCSVTKLCRTLCDPMDYSPPGPSVHGISQARILEWVAISFSRNMEFYKSFISLCVFNNFWVTNKLLVCIKCSENIWQNK